MSGLWTELIFNNSKDVVSLRGFFVSRRALRFPIEAVIADLYTYSCVLRTAFESCLLNVAHKIDSFQKCSMCVYRASRDISAARRDRFEGIPLGNRARLLSAT